MRTIFFILSFLFLINAFAQKHIGTNISAITDYETEIVFSDIFKQSREWIPFEAGGSWSSGVTIPLRPDGYPIEIPYNNGIDPPQYVRTLMFFGLDSIYYPTGAYRLIVSGSGQISLHGSITGTFTCPTDQVVSVDGSGSIILEIDSSNILDPIHDIKLILPGNFNTYQTEPFYPPFLDFISDFKVLRFMDLMQTDYTNIIHWSDRTPYDYYTQTLNSGIAYEYLIELCNTAHKDAWICIPHQADDNYITQFANLLQNNLDSSLNVYVEYTNEAWNSIYPQNQYVKLMGDSLGYTGLPHEKGWKYYAKRSADIHHIFETVFNDKSRVINVVASQAASPYVCNYILDRYNEPLYNPNQVEPEALAIAPYFGGGLADAIGSTGIANTITVNEILDSLEFFSLPTSYLWMQNAKNIALNHNVELMAYEGGQHLVSYSYTNNSNFMDTLRAVNRHERMEDIYCQYFSYWFDTIQGGLFCNFTSHRKPSIYGNWGVKEYLTDTLAPKYLALIHCVFGTVLTTIDNKTDSKAFSIYPNPATYKIYFNSNNNNKKYEIYSLTGRLISHGVVYGNNIDFSNFNKGIYFLQISDMDKLNIVKVIKQ